MSDPREDSAVPPYAAAFPLPDRLRDVISYAAAVGRLTDEEADQVLQADDEATVGAEATAEEARAEQPYAPYWSREELDEFLPAHRPNWWDGATGDEVLLFGLSSANPPNGAGIPGLDSRELRRQLAFSCQRLQDPTTATPWLEQYHAQLQEEADARAVEEAGPVQEAEAW